jgi:hypothetical protein
LAQDYQPILLSGLVSQPRTQPNNQPSLHNMRISPSNNQTHRVFKVVEDFSSNMRQHHPTSFGMLLMPLGVGIIRYHQVNFLTSILFLSILKLKKGNRIKLSRIQ